MGTGIASRIMIAMRVVGWAAIMIVMGLIASTIAASIYGLLVSQN